MREDDQPLNIEGCCFLADGTLLLGLRYPVTAEGHPLLVELVNIEAFFADPDVAPDLGAVWTLDATRAARTTRSGYARCTAPPTATCTPSSAASTRWARTAPLVADHPAAGQAHCEHWAMRLPEHRGGGVVEVPQVTPSRANAASKAWPRCRPGRSCTWSTATTTSTSAFSWQI